MVVVVGGDREIVVVALVRSIVDVPGSPSIAYLGAHVHPFVEVEQAVDEHLHHLPRRSHRHT